MTTAIASRSRYIPWVFVAGFGLVVAVNGTMTWLAVSSFSGLYTSNPRERGMHYNAVVAEQKARDALGWRIEAVWRAEAARLEIAAFDAAGRPLAGARAFVELVRPVEKRQPVDVTMTVVDSGRFAAHIDLPERGNWDVDVVIERDGRRFAQTRRLFLK
jgi:nitrogen fixation protein FixH